MNNFIILDSTEKTIENGTILIQEIDGTIHEENLLYNFSWAKYFNYSSEEFEQNKQAEFNSITEGIIKLTNTLKSNFKEPCILSSRLQYFLSCLTKLRLILSVLEYNELQNANSFSSIWDYQKRFEESEIYPKNVQLLKATDEIFFHGDILIQKEDGAVITRQYLLYKFSDSAVNTLYFTSLIEAITEITNCLNKKLDKPFFISRSFENYIIELANKRTFSCNNISQKIYSSTPKRKKSSYTRKSSKYWKKIKELREIEEEFEKQKIRDSWL